MNPLAKALTEHKEGEADHLSKDSLAFAMRLAAAAREETDRITNRLAEDDRRLLAAETLRANIAEDDLDAVVTLQRMLMTPKYARTLITLLRIKAGWTPEEEF